MNTPADSTTMSEESDPYESPEYAAFAESMVPLCHCDAAYKPCDGVLAGGMCDRIKEDDQRSAYDFED
jgi:hypothetical protein